MMFHLSTLTDITRKTIYFQGHTINLYFNYSKLLTFYDSVDTTKHKKSNDLPQIKTNVMSQIRFGSHKLNLRFVFVVERLFCWHWDIDLFQMSSLKTWVFTIKQVQNFVLPSIVPHFIFDINCMSDGSNETLTSMLIYKNTVQCAVTQNFSQNLCVKPHFRSKFSTGNFNSICIRHKRDWAIVALTVSDSFRTRMIKLKTRIRSNWLH